MTCQGEHGDVRGSPQDPQDAAVPLELADIVLGLGRGVAERPTGLHLSAAVLDASPVGHALVSADQGRIVWANVALARLVGAEGVATLLGRTWEQVTGTRSPATVPEEGDTDLPEQRWNTPVGERWVTVQSVAATQPSESPPRLGVASVPYLMHQVIDVTAERRTRDRLNSVMAELRERNAELERSNEELAQFAYVASHDLSEPLRVIAGHVALLSQRYRGQLDEDADRYIDFAVDGCRRMRTLIEDLLRYSRAGRDLRRERVDMVAVFREAQAAVTAGPTQRQADISIAPDLPIVVGDPSQLRQLATNLLTNAVKFTPAERRAVVAVTAHQEERAWRISVADNGCGIEPQFRERVFRIFQRLHSREVPGTGIGLAICRRVVEQHGGTMIITDGPLGGASVSFSIPDAVEVR